MKTTPLTKVLVDKKKLPNNKVVYQEANRKLIKKKLNAYTKTKET